MTYSITRSVGAWEKGAVNLISDVETVQRMLKKASELLNNPALHPDKVDGVISQDSSKSATVKAIIELQSGFMAKPDGLIHVNQRTWQQLLDIVEKVNGSTPPPELGSEFCFPFSKLPKWDWKTSPRKFGANRNGGKRAHAGCDLYFPAGTWIHAVADGTVVRGPYAFYSGTYAIEIDHGAFIVRYGEVQEMALVKAGDKVKTGQKIARVGHLIGIKVPSDMLHFEMYDKSATGPLTVTGSQSKMASGNRPYQRRKDLIDPTEFLDNCKSKLPPAEGGGG